MKWRACNVCGATEGEICKKGNEPIKHNGEFAKIHLMKCSICTAVYYCSIECQKIDWKEHKKNCAIDKNIIKATLEMKSIAPKLCKESPSYDLSKLIKGFFLIVNNLDAEKIGEKEYDVSFIPLHTRNEKGIVEINEKIKEIVSTKFSTPEESFIFSMQLEIYDYNRMFVFIMIVREGNRHRTNWGTDVHE